LQGIQLLDRGALQQIRGLALVTKLPSHIPQRMASRAENLLQQAQLKGQVKPVRASGIAPGAGIFLAAGYEHGRAGFSALGKVGLPAEQVAEMATQELLTFHSTHTPVDEFLADQLLLPAALASETSQYRVTQTSTHLTTNAWAIAQFGLAEIAIAPDSQLVTVTPVDRSTLT
jgi:RNA 3'-terminal phosphate cyclase (ATP)